MPLSGYDIEQLTSVYGIGRAEAVELGALLNAVEADTASEVSVLAGRALKQLVLVGVIGAAERRDVLAALEARIAESPDVERDADVIKFFTERLVGVSRSEVLVIRDAVYTVPPPPIVACAYPMDMTGGESPYGLLDITGAEENIGSTETVGNPVQNPLIRVGAPTGGFAGTSAKLDFSEGVRVVEHQAIAIPAAANVGPGLEAYRVSGGEYTAALANVCTWAVCAYNDGTFRIRVFRGAGLTEVHSSVVAPPPTTIATIYDANAGTFEVRADDVPLVLSADGYTPAQLVSFLFTNEFTASDASDAGKTLSAKKVTQAADMVGTYTNGETDPCGNEI